MKIHLNVGRFHVNGNNRAHDNDGSSRGMALDSRTSFMKCYKNLYDKICSYENLELAFRKAGRHKALKPYVIEFEKNFNEKLTLLKNGNLSGESFVQSLKGWFGYSMWANIYDYRKKLISLTF